MHIVESHVELSAEYQNQTTIRQELRRNAEIRPSQSMTIPASDLSPRLTDRYQSYDAAFLKLIRMMLEKLVGHDIDWGKWDEKIQRIQKALAEVKTEFDRKLSAFQSTSQFSMDRIEIIQNHQELGFESAGSVTTEDGRQIDFTMRFKMDQDSVMIQVEAADPVVQAVADPLMISLNGGEISLSHERFDFDLNADGMAESIPLSGSGSGIFALDKNRNGQIDNGREVIGALSGDGFSDLKAFDEDNNGWIDDQDAIYQELRIWLKQVDQDKLISLADAHVGAIYLGKTQTPFDLGDGLLRNSGLFLDEDGRAGRIQQIDYKL